MTTSEDRMEQRPRTPGHRVSTRSQKIRIPFAFLIWQASSVLTACRWHTGRGRLVVDLRWATHGQHESHKGPSRANASNAEMPVNTGASNACQRCQRLAEHLDTVGVTGLIPVSPTLQARESWGSKPVSQSPCHARASGRSARAPSRRPRPAEHHSADLAGGRRLGQRRRGGAVLPPQHGALPATPDRGNHGPLAQCADASR